METKKTPVSKTTGSGFTKEEILTETAPVNRNVTPDIQQPVTDGQMATEQIVCYLLFHLNIYNFLYSFIKFRIK
jgi:hypothetical protein